jgi:hypothetical protein
MIGNQRGAVISHEPIAAAVRPRNPRVDVVDAFTSGNGLAICKAPGFRVLVASPLADDVVTCMLGSIGRGCATTYSSPQTVALLR